MANTVWLLVWQTVQTVYREMAMHTLAVITNIVTVVITNVTNIVTNVTVIVTNVTAIATVIAAAANEGYSLVTGERW